MYSCEFKKLDFLFYDFSVIYYDFLNIQPKKDKDKISFKSAYNRVREVR